MFKLEQFQTETRAWIEANCPESMRKPPEGDDDHVWGGRNPSFKHPDQKLWLDRMAERVTNEAIQMHGGIGMTDEFDIGFYIKRARVAQQTFGGYSYHLDRFARLNAY